RLDQLRIAAGQDHLRPLRAGAHLGDDRLDPRALLVALAVDLLGPREERLDLPEVDEHVVAVAGLLDDAGDDLADAVDVLVVHHLPLGLADALQDHLLRGLGGDAAEVLGRDVLAGDLVVRDLRPVDHEVVVGEQRVVLLPRLLLDALELLERALARLVEEAPLEALGQLDRVHAEVARVVELDRRVPGGPRRLLVRREQRVLEGGDERARLDALLALDLADGVDDLLSHPYLPFVDQVGPHDLVVRYVGRLAAAALEPEGALARGDDLAAQALACGPDTDPAPDGAREVLARAQGTLGARRRHLDRVAVEVRSQQPGHPLAERVVDAAGPVDVDAEALLAGQLEGEDLNPGQGRRDGAGNLAVQLSLLVVGTRRHHKKWAPRAHFGRGRNVVKSRIAERFGRPRGRRPAYRSRTIVTGPSFTSSSAILAPKTPVSTGTPRPRRAEQKRS